MLALYLTAILAFRTVIEYTSYPFSFECNKLHFTLYILLVLNESNALLTRMPDVLHPHVGAGGEEEPMDRYKQVANHV